MRNYTIAAVQLDTKDNKDENIKTIIHSIKEAVDQRAKLVAFPEMMNYMGKGLERENAEDIPGYTTNLLAEQAVKHNIWIHCGSIYEKNGVDRPFNTTALINPKGEIVCKYSKLHMFDVDIKDGPSVRESRSMAPGNKITTIDTELGTLGFAICYDMRFPELFKIMALKGAKVIFVPANFTLNTGKDHWEPLLRARAIENTCYIVAPAQVGNKPSFQAYGKTMIIDPWGNVIAKAIDKPCVITAKIDMDYLDNIRSQVPSLKNIRNDVFEIIEK